MDEPDNEPNQEPNNKPNHEPNTDASGSQESGSKQKEILPVPMEPRECRGHIRKEASNVWNVIVGNLLNKAKAGSVPHITLVAKLAGFEQGPMPPKEPKRRTRSLAQELREEMEALEAKNIAQFGE